MSKTKNLQPEYLVKRSEDWPEWLIVTCPRESCGETFLVKAKSWRKARVYESRTSQIIKEYIVTGRSCPYCMRVSTLPRRIPPVRG